MDVLSAIHGRRSIRKYTEDLVAASDVRDILAAAMAAPSAGNAQPWRFVVVDDRALLEAIPAFSQYAAMAAKAPLGILVCADLTSEKYPGYWVQDCSAAVQNILLAVYGKGLGAVWTGVHPMKDREDGFRRLLGLPDNVVPLGFIVIGHPAQELAPQDRYDEAKVHWNGW